MDPALIDTVLKAADGHSGHLIFVLAFWVLKGVITTVREGIQDFLKEFREMKASMVLLNQQMATVVGQVQGLEKARVDHDQRIQSLEIK